MGLVTLALIAPATGKTQRRPQFQGLCALRTGGLHGTMEACFRLLTVGPQPQLSFKPMEFGFEAADAGLLSLGERFAQRGQGFLDPASFPTDLDKKRQPMNLLDFGADCAVGIDSGAEAAKSLLGSPL